MVLKSYFLHCFKTIFFHRKTEALKRPFKGLVQALDETIPECQGLKSIRQDYLFQASSQDC